MKLGKFTIAWDWHHSAIVIGSAISGALVAYLQTQPLDQLLVALTSGSWAKLQPIVMGALVAVAGSLLALAKHTFVVPTPPDAPASTTTSSAPKPPTSFLPPAVKRVALAFVFSTLSLGAIATTGAAVTGCTAAQWANFQTNVAAFISYAQTYLQAASMIWGMISPLLGQNAAVANKAFNDAFTGVTTALALTQDAVAVANAAQQPLDLPTLLAPIKDAIARLEAVISQFQPASGASLGTAADELARMNAKIQAWR